MSAFSLDMANNVVVIVFGVFNIWELFVPVVILIQ